MGKTNKGGKGPGYEYWSRRPSKEKFPAPGGKSKTITHRLERRESRNIEQQAKKELE